MVIREEGRRGGGWDEEEGIGNYVYKFFYDNNFIFI